MCKKYYFFYFQAHMAPAALRAYHYAKLALEVPAVFPALAPAPYYPNGPFPNYCLHGVSHVWNSVAQCSITSKTLLKLLFTPQVTVLKVFLLRQDKKGVSQLALQSLAS